MQMAQVFSAIFFFLLAAATGFFGVSNLMTVRRTVFGPASVDPTLPTLQIVLAIVFIVGAIWAARQCYSSCKKCLSDEEQEG